MEQTLRQELTEFLNYNKAIVSVAKLTMREICSDVYQNLFSWQNKRGHAREEEYYCKMNHIRALIIEASNLCIISDPQCKCHQIKSFRYFEAYEPMDLKITDGASDAIGNNNNQRKDILGHFLYNEIKSFAYTKNKKVSEIFPTNVDYEKDAAWPEFLDKEYIVAVIPDYSRCKKNMLKSPIEIGWTKKNTQNLAEFFVYKYFIIDPMTMLPVCQFWDLRPCLFTKRVFVNIAKQRTFALKNKIKLIGFGLKDNTVQSSDFKDKILFRAHEHICTYQEYLDLLVSGEYDNTIIDWQDYYRTCNYRISYHKEQKDVYRSINEAKFMKIRFLRIMI